LRHFGLVPHSAILVKNQATLVVKLYPDVEIHEIVTTLQLTGFRSIVKITRGVERQGLPHKWFDEGLGHPYRNRRNIHN